jgi:ribosomal protein S27E
MIFEEIVKVQIGKNPDFTNEIKDISKFYTFKCPNCGNLLKMDYNNQIKNCWIGYSDMVDKNLFEKLKRFYDIGILNKSIEGGFPVFDKLQCKKCNDQYITYSGVKEYYNSLYNVTLNGILKLTKY